MGRGQRGQVPQHHTVREGCASAMTTSPRVMVLDGTSRRGGELGDLLRARGFEPACVTPAEALEPRPAPGWADVAVLVADPASPSDGPVAAVLRKLVEEKVATVVCGAEDGLQREGGPLVEWLAADASPEEVIGKVGTLAHYVPLLRGFERELSHLHRLGDQLNRYFGEIDQEMRLAGRLQRDFLPREMPSVPPIRFEGLYRPASWVSGDMYDAFRIDEHHVGLFIADAMGHGVAAGLLTMFLRQSLVAKRITGGAYEIIEPVQALESVHACLLRQKLPNSQFVTAAYGIVDTRTCELRLARAGHPYPLHVRADGAISEVRSSGSLLGLPDVPTDFEEARIVLGTGDKVILYTDGVEDEIVQSERHGDDVAFTTQFRGWAPLGATDFVRAVGDHLDGREGSLHPADDVTMLVLEVGSKVTR